MKYNICVYEYLNNEHRDILHEMICDGFYILQDKVYDVLYDITYYGSVVGYICGCFSDGGLVCELCYIISEFRGYGLFVKALNVLDLLFDVDIILELPNSFAMDSLLSNKLAIKIDDTLIVSYFHLSFLKQNGTRVKSRLYDTRNCGIIQLQEEIMSPLQDIDAQYINSNREHINHNYFKKIREKILLKIGGKI